MRINFPKIWQKVKEVLQKNISLSSIGQALSLILVLLAIFWFFSTSPNKIPKNSPNSEFLSVPQEQIPVEILQFGLRIDKLSILAPVIANVDGTNKSTYYQALEKGLAHYKGTALPDAGSNIFIFGHSSSATGTGQYFQIFAPLGNLVKGDKITIYYQNKTYEYEVSQTKIIEKTDLSVLKPTKNEQLTLMTCWPIGTSAKRLIVIAVPK